MLDDFSSGNADSVCEVDGRCAAQEGSTADLPTAPLVVEVGDDDCTEKSYGCLLLKSSCHILLASSAEIDMV